MKIGLAGPIDLNLLSGLLGDCPALAPGYSFPQAHYLAADLIQRGHEVAVFALDPGRTASTAYTGRNWELHICPLRQRARERARDLFRTERVALMDAMRSTNCDLIHAAWSYEFAWAALSSGVPTLTTFHDWAPAILRMHRDTYRAARLVMSARTLATRTRFTAVSPYIAERIHRYTRSTPPVVPNFVTPSWFAQSQADLAPTPLLLAVNNGWDNRKNVATLLQAMPHVRASCPEVRLALVGTGYEPGGPAHTWAQHRSLADNIHFHGPLPHEDLTPLMRQATLFVHPAREESFGVVLIEAMACGVPVIAGAGSGGVPWVLDYGRAGILTNIDSATTLATSILALLDNPSKRDELARLGIENAQARFSLDVVVEAYLQEYSTLPR